MSDNNEQQPKSYLEKIVEITGTSCFFGFFILVGMKIWAAINDTLWDKIFLTVVTIFGLCVIMSKYFLYCRKENKSDE